MEKNKSYGNSVRSGGAKGYIDAAGICGYGLNSDAPFSKGQGTYDPHPQDAAPINLSGKENFTDARFSGDRGGKPAPEGSVDSGNDRDGIERMGSHPDNIGRKF